ncbi:MAG: GAF domain-containing sensor histidine kinase [Candidatus Promineifilaceae bacterium]|nr:GAF domain-containing sensor histidine kinase [Candidatus Promineifilaceae bacterium]
MTNEVIFKKEYSAAQALDALNQAALAIAGELDSDKVLQQIVETARDLVGARYAALGVPGQDGKLIRFLTSGMTQENQERISHPPRGRGLLGALVGGRDSIRVKNIADDSRSFGFPEGHPQMTSFLGVPILGGSGPLGNLYLTDKIAGNEFSESDQRLVEMLAAHAAIAIQNSKLYEQVERLAILEERTRIGMDLHDGVIQSIYAVGLTLESIHLAMPSDEVELVRLLDTAIEGLNEAIRDIRNFILDLRPRRFSGDLSQGLARLVREFQANTMIPVTMTISQQLDSLPLTAARALFLTTQESLANVARHARAENVILTLMRMGTAVTLKIEDDGRGFEPFDDSRAVGHGLANMQARAEGMGGQFDVKSAPGQGTIITLKIPL